MKHKFYVVFVAIALAAAAGCQKRPQTSSDAIRDGIRTHLTSLKTLNLSAMDMNLSNVSITGDTAQALVEYIPKTGAPAGAAMRVSYSLEKRGDQWVVVKTNAVGGAIDHPAQNVNPHTQPAQGEVHGTLPNFRDLVSPAPPDSARALPPGHPPR
jgi:hypothetical protein